MFSYELFVVFELYYEKRGFMMMSSVIASVLNIALNYLFIPIFGYNAAGYTTLFCYIVNAFVHYIFMCKVCRDNLEGERAFSSKALLAISGVFGLLGFAFLSVYNLWYLRYGFVGVIAILAIANRKKFVVLKNMIFKKVKTDV